MKKNLFILLAVLLVLPVAVVYASSYTGPGDRTISSGSQCDIVLRYCAQNHNGWRWVADRSWSCGNQSQPWLSWPELSGTCSPVREGEYGWQEERRPTDPVTYDPVSTAYSLTCGTPGNVGWCRGGLTLTLSATEPIPGYNVRRFDDVSGVLCNPSNAPSVTCAIPVTQQGAHTNEFWALSTYGDTSHKRAYTWRLDGLAPALAGTASGSQSGEWYTSDVTVSLSGTDAISGIASSTYRYRVNDGAWQSGANLTLATDGVYAIHAEVQDVAGNIGARNLSIHLDKTPPTLNPVLSGTQQNGWYRTAVKAAANAADETSGIVSVEYRLNGGAWQAGGNLSLDTEGNHEVEFRATDNAGHITARTITLQIDLTAPTVTTTLSPNGLNGWYVSHPLIPLSALDGLSGVAPDSLQYRWDGLDWTAGESVLVSRDGPHFLEARATDLAGNSGEAVFEVWVDTTPPELEIVVTSESPQHNGWYRESATVTAIATDATSGVSEVSYRLQTAEWQPGSQIVLRDGDHQLTMRATDDAGNMAEEARRIRIDRLPPRSTFAPPGGPLSGLVLISGNSVDATSGIAHVEHSLDGGLNWQVLPHSDGEWTILYDTSLRPDGEHRILVRASDLAGNVETPAVLNVTVSNAPPKVSISKSWWIWESGRLVVRPGVAPLGSLRLQIACPGLQDVVLDFKDLNQLPREFNWNRRCGDGILAAPGEYKVTLTACTIHGRCESDTGVITIPEGLLVVQETATPAPVPTGEPTRIQPSHTPTMIPMPVVLPVMNKHIAQAPDLLRWPLWLLPVAGLAGLVLALGANHTRDPRPKAVEKLANMFTKQKSSINNLRQNQ